MLSYRWWRSVCHQILRVPHQIETVFEHINGLSRAPLARGMLLTSSDLVQYAVTLVLQQGRDAKTKQKLYAALADRLKAECGVDGNDLIVTVSRNEKEDWSFGNGKAQFLTGDL